MRNLQFLGAAAAIGLTLVSASAAGAAQLDPQVSTEGRRLVQRNCAVCHAVGLRDVSKHPGAPAFRDLHTRYPIEMLAEALAEGMLTGHPEMPEFKFTPRQIDSIIAYLRSIQTKTEAARAERLGRS